MAELTKEEEQTDWYAVLDLKADADDGAVRKAFKRLSLRWHPDKNQGSKDAHDKFMQIKEAEAFLLDSKKRKAYDEKRMERQRMESLLVILESFFVLIIRPHWILATDSLCVGTKL